MNAQEMWNEYKELILVIAGGLFSIVAAVLKTKMKLSASLGWLVASVVCLIGGGVMLRVEYAKIHFDPDKALDLENYGAMLMLGGALLLSTGIVWGLINLMRTLFGGSPKDDERPRKRSGTWRARVAVAAWIIVLVATAGTFKGFERYRTTRSDSPLQEYQEQWKRALGDALRYPAPDLEACVAKAPAWRQDKLRREFEKQDAANKKTYDGLLERKFQDQVGKFRGRWELAVQDFSDAPTVDQFVNAATEDEKKEPLVADANKEKLKKLLENADTECKALHPRTKLAIDGFSGYCVFRSPEFKERVINLGIKLHLVDDAADYTKRIETLETGETPLAVFTVDALITASAKRKAPPASMLMIIDESRGADAIVAYKKGVPSIGALNKPNAKIIFGKATPSETLARFVRSQMLPRLSPESFLPLDDPDQDKLLERFKGATPEERAQPTAYVMWEPYVSMALEAAGKDAHVLYNSGECPGVIVDVFVAQKKFLEATDDEGKKTNREQVRKIMQAYFETVQELRGRMTRAVGDDWQRLLPDKPLTEKQMQQVERGIQWKDEAENYARLGLESDNKLDTLTDMTRKIEKFLKKTYAISKELPPEQLIDPSLCKEMRDNWMQKAPSTDKQKEKEEKRRKEEEEAYQKATGQARSAEQEGKLEEALAAFTQALKLRPRDEAAQKGRERVAALLNKSGSKDDYEKIPLVDSDVAFKKGSADITDVAETTLGEVAALLAAPQSSLEITGHAENDQEMAQKRVDAVRDWLVEKKGIAKDRLLTATDTTSNEKVCKFVLLKKRKP